jgi:type VI secretion system secreted protein Hcp
MAVDMFMKIGDLKGEAKDKTHKEEIDVLAWSWGMSNSGSAHMGGGAGAGKVSVQDLSFTKYIDKASTNLIMACCTGKHFDDATLVVRKAGDTPLEYIIIKMKEVLITAVSTGGSGGEDRLTENVTLNFASFVTEYKPQKADGTGEASSFAKYNIAENVKE